MIINKRRAALLSFLSYEDMRWIKHDHLQQYVNKAMKYLRVRSSWRRSESFVHVFGRFSFSQTKEHQKVRRQISVDVGVGERLGDGRIHRFHRPTLPMEDLLRRVRGWKT